MTSFLSLDRSSLWPRSLSFAQAFVERHSAINRLNTIVSLLEDCTSNEFLSRISTYCGEYELPGTIDLIAEQTPKVFVANHPLGGAEIIAALKLMESLRAPYKIIANNVLAPPKVFANHVVLVDPVREDRNQNMQALRTILREFGSAYKHLFIFPAGYCSRFLPLRRIITDPSWSNTFYRIAIQKQAQIVPIWFSGRNRLRFYLYALTLCGAAGLLIPREFFKKRKKRLVCRIGTPIPADAMAYFGTAAIAGLRAAVYTLAQVDAGGAQPGRQTTLYRSRSIITPAATEVTAFSGAQVDRTALLALRRESFGRDDWSCTDEVALHLVAHTAGGCPIGYYRVLDWDAIGSDLAKVSPVCQVYRLDREIIRKHRVLEFGRFCIRPDHRVVFIAHQIWQASLRLALSRGSTALAIGMITLDQVNSVLAAAYFEYVRRLSCCERTLGFQARQELVTRSPHHDFSPTDIKFYPASLVPLPQILRIYLALGMRFGPSARWIQFGDRPCVIASIRPDELRLT
jgi:hypothetical protein